VSKILGFLLGIAVALAVPAMFGVLTADGGLELNAKEMALAYGIGALIFWAVVSSFSGAAALGAALTFGVMIYAVHWVPNRMTNFLDDVPGVTTGMIQGVRQYTLNGLVPVLAAISLVYAIQLMVATARRRRLRAENDRLRHDRQLTGQQQDIDSTGQYPGSAGDYPTSVDNYAVPNSYDDQDQEGPIRFPAGKSFHDEQTAQFSPDAPTAWTDNDETVQIPPGEQADEPTVDQPGTGDDTHRNSRQYRERTDDPRLDIRETDQYPRAFLSPGHSFIGFPAQTQERPHSRFMDLPGQFRPAGA